MLRPKKGTFGTIELKCIFDGTVCGTAQYSKKKYATPPPQEALGYVDVRCDACVLNYGDFKKMTEDYRKRTGSTSQEAQDFVKKNRKKSEFNREIEKIL